MRGAPGNGLAQTLEPYETGGCVLGLFKKKGDDAAEKGKLDLVAEPFDGADLNAAEDIAEQAAGASTAFKAIEAADVTIKKSKSVDKDTPLSDMLEESSVATGLAVEPGQEPEAAEADVDEIMRKYDRESNTRIWEGVPKVVVSVLMAAFSVYCIYMTLFSTVLPETRLSLFVGFIIVIGYIMYPARKGKVKVNHIPWYDIVIMLAGAFAFFYFAFNALDVIKLATRIEPIHVVLGIIGVLVLMELCRRCVGIPILVVVGCLLIYVFYWQFGNNAEIYMALRNVVYKVFYTTSGVIGTPINVCYTYIVLFIIFGAFLERTGIAAFFISLANRIAGWSSGGAAKVAVISSALCGMVSGSSVGNTVTTGSVTIPMMKKTGYKGEFAGAVEAAASTGGQIMPPIMGAAAYIVYRLLFLATRRPSIGLLVSIPAAVLIYLVVYVKISRVPEKELARYPGGQYIVRVLKKIHIY
mgnify:CR=1 FL=1